MGKVVKHNKLY